MMSSLSKPVLFLDVDRTLFDTERFYTWIGPDRYAGILALLSGERELPDFAEYLYPDALAFVTKMRARFRVVLLSYSVNTLLQRRKIRGSGLAAVADDVLIVQEDKGTAAKEYLSRFHASGWKHIFVDDAPENLADMKRANPEFFVIRIGAKGAVPSEDGGGEDALVSDLAELETLLAGLPR